MAAPNPPSGGPVRPIRIAAQLHPQHGDYPGLRRAAVQAEAMGYDIAYNWDHFYPLYGDRTAPHLECWSVLAGWAEATEHDRDRAARQLHLVSEPAPAGRHRPDRRPRQRRPGRSSGSGPAGRSGTTREYGYEFGTMGSPDRPPRRGRSTGSATGSPCSNPPPVRPMPSSSAASACAGRCGSSPRRRRLARDVPGPAGRAPAGGGRPARWCDEVGRDPAAIEWGVGVEPEDLQRFVDRGRRDLRRHGLHPVHARLRRSVMGRRRRGALPPVAGRAEPLAAPAVVGRGGR